MKPAEKKQHILAAKIEYYRKSAGYSKEQIADVLGLAERSFRRYMQAPEKFTVIQIVTLSRLFNTTELIDTLFKMSGKLKRPEAS